VGILANRMYVNGSRFERIVREYLRSVYHMNTLRSAGSKGLVDVVGFNKDVIWIIQCKQQRSKIRYDGAEVLLSYMEAPSNAQKLLVVHDVKHKIVTFKDVVSGKQWVVRWSDMLHCRKVEL
jgi:Holliday junction resolvase